MNESQKVRLVVFAKIPQPGGVKTRLAESVGPETACELYRTWVPPFVRELLRGGSASLEVSLAPSTKDMSDEKAILDRAMTWIPGVIDWSFQTGDGLGARLASAFEKQFDRGWKRVLALGSDSPHLSWNDLKRCIDLIESRDLVLGPTEDGGYYAVGMKSRPGDLFNGVRWSSSMTLEDTRSKAESQGWSVGLGPVNYDIDTIDDLNRLIRERAVDCWTQLENLLKED